MNVIIYDIEIAKAIPDRKEARRSDVQYCEGWSDHANMGISCIGVYDYKEDRARVFFEDNISEFFELVRSRDMLVGFNSIAFDNAVIDVTYGREPMPGVCCYDLLREIWAANGLGPKFDFTTHGGYGLDAMCQANFGTRKTGHGGAAPILFQKGQIGKLIDYCLNDVCLTKQLFERVVSLGRLSNPRGPDLLLRHPFLKP